MVTVAEHTPLSQLNVLHMVHTSPPLLEVATTLCENIKTQGHASALVQYPALPQTLYQILGQAWGLRKRLRSHPQNTPTVLHLHHPAFLPVAWLATLGVKQVKTICSLHEKEAPTSLQKTLLSHLSAVVTTGEKPYFLSPTSHVTIPPGVDTGVFSLKKISPLETDGLWAEWNIPAAAKVVYIPTQTLQANVATSAIVTALSHVHDVAFKAIIAGGYTTHPEAFSTLWQHIEEAKLSKKVLFIGVPQTPEAVLYSAADLVITPAIGPFAAQAILKAQAMGKPVIALRENEAFFQNGKTGWAFDPTHPSSLASTLQKALADAATLHKMGKEGVNFVKTQHTHTHLTENTLALYQTALKPTVKRVKLYKKGLNLLPFLLPLLLTACAENFTWQDPKTWHFKLNEEQRAYRNLQNACTAPTTEEERRVVLINGVADRIEHTECHPYTTRPLTPQRLEGR